MKDFVKQLGVLIVTVAISVVATLAAIKYAGHSLLPQTFDSSVVTAQVNVQSSQELKSLTDVFQLRQEMMDESRIDSTFLSMSDSSLSNVVAVLLKRAGTTNKDDIVNEYLAGQAVYDNLPPQVPMVQSNATTTQSNPIASVAVVKEESTTVTEGPPTRVGDTKSPPSDTVIDGKRYKQIE